MAIGKKRKTIFIDIDGTLIKHLGDFTREIPDPEILDGVREKFIEWANEDAIIIITTARKESLREITHNQLVKLGLHYNHLIMSIGSGERVVINDTKIGSDEPTALAYTVKRDTGLKDCPY